MHIEAPAALCLDYRESSFEKKRHQAEGQRDRKAHAIGQTEPREGVGKFLNPSGGQKERAGREKGADFQRHAQPKEYPFARHWKSGKTG